MGKRTKLGLILTLDENWIGGTYYILNLIHALNTLNDEDKPHIVILSNLVSDFEMAKETGYPYLSYKNPNHYKRNLFEKLINSFIRIFTRKNIIDKRINNKDIDFLFPAYDGDLFERISNKIYWFPDFQHIRYPEYFDEQELVNRNKSLDKIITSNNPLILSSKDAYNDLKKTNKDIKCPVYIIPFAVTHQDFSECNIEDLKTKYDINDNYFIVCNQFWKHKNHMLIFKAISELKESGYTDFQIVFTGKENDRRNPGYYDELLQYIKEEKIDDYVKILGLIPRKEQLTLIKFSKSIIQPSLFEGWSTIVEDAKAINKHIIVSDIPVHKEQLQGNYSFFNHYNTDGLKKLIIKLNHEPIENHEYDYNKNIQQFGKQFINILND